jgi:hypothetical protein
METVEGSLPHKRATLQERDAITFPLAYIPVISSNIQAAPVYKFYISQLIRYYRACSQYVLYCTVIESRIVKRQRFIYIAGAGMRKVWANFLSLFYGNR